MESTDRPVLNFVIKAKKLAALNYMERGHPGPLALTWINRGTDQNLNPTTVAMPLRTLFRPATTPSVVRLHDSAGLRATFARGKEREAFARCFAAAIETLHQRQRTHLTAMFDSPVEAEHGIRELTEAGIPGRAISIL